MKYRIVEMSLALVPSWFYIQRRRFGVWWTLRHPFSLGSSKSTDVRRFRTAAEASEFLRKLAYPGSASEQFVARLHSEWESFKG